MYNEKMKKMINKELNIPKKFFSPNFDFEPSSEHVFYVEGDEDVTKFSNEITMAEFGKWVNEKDARCNQVDKLAQWLEEFTNGDNDLAVDLLKKELTKRTSRKKIREFCPVMIKDNNVYYLQLDNMRTEKITFRRANVAKTLYIFFLRQIERASMDSTVPKCLSKVEIAENRQYLDEIQKIYERISGKKCDIRSWFQNSVPNNDFINAISSIRKAFEKIFFIPHIKVCRKCYSIEIMGEDSYGNSRYGIGLGINNFDLGEFSILPDED